LSHVKNNQPFRDLIDGCYLLGELSPRTSDTILSFGELLSAFIIAEALKQNGNNSIYKRELIKTNNHFGKAIVNFDVSNALITDFFASNENQVVVMPGFIAASLDGITTLGRGGSDYSAAILAGALNATDLEIWTDVNGMFTANPKL
jgi:aspartokinase/homoserine dehydrogenase 1